MIKNVMIVGQKWLAAELLKACLERQLNITCVAAPDLTDSLAVAANVNGLPLVLVKGQLRAEDVPVGTDIILCAHAHCYITSEARTSSRLGAVGYHPSLLPRHRGRDAIHWAIHMREPVTGGTVYWMDDGADTGAIAAQDWCWISPSDTPATLWREKLAPMGLNLLVRILDDLVNGRLRKEQQDCQHATWEPALKTKRLSESG
jgi:methionyl-tRNA formyltransferase